MPVYRAHVRRGCGRVGVVAGDVAEEIAATVGRMPDNGAEGAGFSSRPVASPSAPMTISAPGSVSPVEDAAQFECCGVGPDRVVIRRHHRKRAIRHDPVERVPVGALPRTENVVVGADGVEQRVVWLALAFGADGTARQPRPRSPQGSGSPVLRTAEQVHVAVDQAGQDGLATGVDDRRRRTESRRVEITGGEDALPATAMVVAVGPPGPWSAPGR